MADEQYAVAVRDEDRLFLFMRIRRSKKGEFFAMLPRPHDKSIDAHASYHADGQVHFKSQGTPKIMHRRKPKPDRMYSGTGHILDQGIVQSGPRSIGELCEPMEWVGVFEIPVSDLSDGNVHRTHVTVDLVGDGAKPELVPNARVIRQARYGQTPPYLVVTLYEMPL